MSPLSKCSGEGCSRREYCYRVSALSSGENQSWIRPVKDCEHFIARRDAYSTREAAEAKETR